MRPVVHSLRALLPLLWLLNGCSVQPPAPQAEIRGLIIQNLTRQTVLNARIRVIEKHQFVSCQNILPRQSCSTTFPARHPQGLPVEIVWQFSPDRIKRQVINVAGLEYLKSASALTAIIYLDDDSVAGEFQPCHLQGVCEPPRDWDLP